MQFHVAIISTKMQRAGARLAAGRPRCSFLVITIISCVTCLYTIIHVTPRRGIPINRVGHISYWYFQEEATFEKTNITVTGSEEFPTYPNLLLANTNLCRFRTNITFFYVYSSWNRTEARDTIRETYLNADLKNTLNIVSVFILGRKDLSDQHIPNDISEEQTRYGDIIVGDFLDTYRNLSLKGLTALHYITRYCENAHFVIKADDDVFVDTPSLMRVLTRHFLFANRTIAGFVYEYVPPIRCEKHLHKWCINKSEYSRERYPPYVVGNGFVLTGDLVPDLYRAASLVPPHAIDDAFFTGLLGETIPNKQFVNLRRHVKPNQIEAAQWCSSDLDTKLEDKNFEPMLIGHLPNISEIRRCWDVIQQYRHRYII